MLSPDILASLREAHNNGYQYIVTTYKKCLLGNPGTIISFHHDLTEAQSTIKNSVFGSSMSSHVIEVLLANYSYFYKTK